MYGAPYCKGKTTLTLLYYCSYNSSRRPTYTRHSTTTTKMDLLRVHSQDLHEHIAQEVGECLESGLYTDLAIRCAEGQTLHAHRLVMAAVSPYLQMVTKFAIT